MGPPKPNCEQRLYSSLVGTESSPSLFIRGLFAALPPEPGVSFRDIAGHLLEEAGYETPEQLRSLPGLPAGRWICHELPPGAPEPEAACPLLSAAILGLSNPSFYSPDRSVLWTDSRLARRFVLLRPRGFYED